MNPNPGNAFGDAEAYEGYVGRWSRLVAQQFITWLDVGPGRTWLDVGSGTGILSDVILQQASPAKVVGVDFSPEYVAFARQRFTDDRVEFNVADAASFALESPQFDASVAGLVLNFLPAPEQGLRSMWLATRVGGTVAAYIWDYGGQMEMMRHFWDAAAVIDPSSKAMDSGQRFAIARPENLRALFESEGLKAVEVIPIDIQTRFTDFDDYWLPFLGAQGSISKYFRGLDDTMRIALRDQIRKQLPFADDRSITLRARAWAAKGTRA